MVIYFEALGSGIGDVLVCKPAFEWLAKNSAEPVMFVARGPRQAGLSSLLDGANGEVREVDLPQIVKPEDRVVNLRDHRWQTNHDWYSPEFKELYGHMKVQDILGEICADKGISADQREMKPLPFKRDRRAEKKIILVPGSVIKSKKLGTTFWLKLFERLTAQHREVIMLGTLKYSEQLHELISAGIPHLETPHLQDAIDVIGSCDGVIAVDTGLMHIAVQQQIRTVVIFGECEVYYRPSPFCFPIFTDKRISSLSSGAEYQTYQFSSTFDNWDYLVSSSEDGEYLQFDDVDSVLALLG